MFTNGMIFNAVCILQITGEIQTKN